MLSLAVTVQYVGVCCGVYLRRCRNYMHAVESYCDFVGYKPNPFLPLALG
jgi:hypothetical protein